MKTSTKCLFPQLALALLLVPSFVAVSQTISSASTPVAGALTAVPALVGYSGTALNAQGSPLSGEASITFLIFQDQTGGEPLFTETQSVVLDPTGHYKVNLGATLSSGLPAGLFSTGEARWVEVQIAGQRPQPRVLLVSVPYAMLAADASTLGGLPASAFVLAGEGVKAAVASAGVTPDAASNVTTTGGTAGYVPEFNGATTIVDSPIFVLSGNVGIGTTAPTTTLDVVGTGATIDAPLVLTATGTATASDGFSSNLLKFYTSAWNSSTKAVVEPRFEWEAVESGNDTASPTATLELLSSTSTASAAPTGFFFNANGTINFATGQTFPGADITGMVNASGYDLSGSLFATGSISNRDAYLGFSGSSSNTGTGNTGVGAFALESNTTGYENTASGDEALASNTTGHSNTATGDYALDFNTSGIQNTADGELALYSNSTGGANTAVGTEALEFNSTGTLNTAVGYIAGPDSSSTDLIYATAIGAFATVSQSNTVVLGETTTGKPGETYMNVGIGTATPRSTLEVAVQASGRLGPVLTLTNSGGNSGAAAAMDFNSYLPSASGTYNPAARIEALDNNWADDLVFQANKQGSPNQGLLDTMVVYPNGDVTVLGTLSASAKDFKIDHPLDPANKFLVHSSVESAEMMNIYSGNVITDELGLATVRLPEWFEAENTDFRYQLTVIGRKAQAWIAEEVGHGQFKIASDATNTKISWQITAVRQDAYAQAHPLVVEQEKSERERGFTYDKPRLTHDQPARLTSNFLHPRDRTPAINRPSPHPAVSEMKPTAELKQP